MASLEDAGKGKQGTTSDGTAHTRYGPRATDVMKPATARETARRDAAPPARTLSRLRLRLRLRREMDWVALAGSPNE